MVMSMDRIDVRIFSSIPEDLITVQYTLKALSLGLIMETRVAIVAASKKHAYPVDTEWRFGV